MIYDKSGNVISAVYNKSGAQVNPVYGIGGNPISIATELTVMTYNYQWCTRLNTLSYQQSIISAYKPDIIGLQEAGNQGRKEFPSIAQSSLAEYPYKYLSDYYNYNGIASKVELEDITDNVYVAQAGSGIYTYQKCYLYVGGKRIAWYNTHLEYDTTQSALNRKYAQATELFNDAETEDYVIITGDFNMYGDGFLSADYIGVGKQFADANYNLANWTENNGFINTWGDSKTAQTFSELEYPCDNIIVSSNIDILSTIFDTIKFAHENGTYEVDHIPVVARVAIN